MAKAFYTITGVSGVGNGAIVEYLVVVFDTPSPDNFSSNCTLIAGLTGLQTSMLIASKVTQDIVSRGNPVNVGDVISLTPTQ